MYAYIRQINYLETNLFISKLPVDIREFSSHSLFLSIF